MGTPRRHDWQFEIGHLIFSSTLLVNSKHHIVKIYTKKGDRGTTMLFGGRKVPKHHPRVNAYGAVDECGVYVGMVRSSTPDDAIKNYLIIVQNKLFEIGAILATQEDKEPSFEVQESEIQKMEEQIDAIDKNLEPLKNFIMPGGPSLVFHTHLARVQCRNAERLLSALNEYISVPPTVIMYMNRLSDYFFVLARHHAKLSGEADIKWLPS